MWEISVNNQIITFLLSIVLGFLICALYDIFRSLRKIGLNSFAATFVEDILFWIVSAFITFLFLLSRTNGEPRGYVLLAALLGFLVFRSLFSGFLIIVLTFLFRTILKTYRFIYVWFYRFWDKTAYLLSELLLKFIKIGKRWAKMSKKLLKNRYKLLYTKRKIKASRNGDENYGNETEKA